MLAVFETCGALRVALYGPDGASLLTGANPGVVQGPAAHDAPAAGNPLRAGAVYRAQPASVADGDIVDLLADAAGRLVVRKARLYITLFNALAVRDTADYESSYADISGMRTKTLYFGNGLDQSVTIEFRLTTADIDALNTDLPQITVAAGSYGYITPAHDTAARRLALLGDYHERLNVRVFCGVAPTAGAFTARLMAVA